MARKRAEVLYKKNNKNKRERGEEEKLQSRMNIATVGRRVGVNE
jgi:hypothetical protein